MKNEEPVQTELYHHLIDGVEYSSPLKTNCCVPFDVIKGINSRKLPKGVWIDTHDINYPEEEPFFIPTIMIKNEGVSLRVFVTDGTDTSHCDQSCTTRNSLKSQLITFLEASNLPDILEYPLGGNISVLAYSVKRKHDIIEKVLLDMIEYADFIENILDLDHRFPGKLSLLDLILKPGKPVRNTIPELIIPYKNYHYWKVTAKGIVKEYSPEEN